MNPTPRLRFVERSTFSHFNGGGKEVWHTVKVLQQWFAQDVDYPAMKGYWQDVPTESEQDAKTF